MRVAVVGVGGVGGYFGGRLAEKGESVAFLARGTHLAALKRDGLKVLSISGDMVLRDIEASEEPSSVGPVDLVLVAVKAWQVKSVAETLKPLLRPDTVVLPLQNGVEAADELSAVLGAERVVGGLCKISSFVAGPGVIRHVGVAPRVEMGELKGGETERVRRVAAVFGSCKGVSAVVPENIEVALWEKFLFIAPVGGIGSVTRMTMGVARAHEGSRRLLEEAMREVFYLARARGVDLAEGAVERTLAYVDTLPPETTASMQRDILEGRPSELEYQTGAVVRLARGARVPVPVHEFLYQALAPGEWYARGGEKTAGGKV